MMMSPEAEDEIDETEWEVSESTAKLSVDWGVIDGLGSPFFVELGAGELDAVAFLLLAAVEVGLTGGGVGNDSLRLNISNIRFALCSMNVPEAALSNDNKK